jgi:hypothetical protein
LAWPTLRGSRISLNIFIKISLLIKR